MDLAELQRHWNQLGADDPLWAILTEGDKRHGQWDIKEFFGSGQKEIRESLELADQVAAASGLTVARGRAMDFGCGVGRLTQALAEHFQRADGVDIAASMIDGARRFNRHGERCQYHHNTGGDLSRFPTGTFDFIYTARVLQHMRPEWARGYVGEFVRALKKGGVLLFQITTSQVFGAAEPLPEDAFRASLRFAKVPRKMAPGATARVSVQVRNDSNHTWPAAGSSGWFLITAGNHWSSEGTRVVNDDARARLPHDLAPGESATVDLTVTAPAKKGSFVLEADLCQEGVAWFGDRGSELASAQIKVTGRAKSSPGGPATAREEKAGGDQDEARMEMYATSVEDVTGWVRAYGGTVLRVVGEDLPVSSGVEWQSRQFLVTK